MEELLDDLYYEGPIEFSADRLAHLPELFRSRAALFYTPTINLPDNCVGHGPIDVELPLAFPTTFDADQNKGCWCPRLWVDLIQRATTKIRWTPMVPAVVYLVRYDYATFSEHNLHGGVKSLLDSLKCGSTGRRDGRVVHYFGAIRDDNLGDLHCLRITQEKVDAAREARTRIIVIPAS